MATLTYTYPNEVAARRAVEELRTVRGHDIRLLVGSAPHDVRREPVGGVAGPIGPDAPVGTFGGTVLRRSQGTGGYSGDPDRQRQGSYADADRVVIVTLAGGAERSRITGRRGIRRLLRQRAELDAEAVEGIVGELSVGRSVVLVAGAGEERLPRAA
jgi:hypothetical protein